MNTVRTSRVRKHTKNQSMLKNTVTKMKIH